MKWAGLDPQTFVTLQHGAMLRTTEVAKAVLSEEKLEADGSEREDTAVDVGGRLRGLSSTGRPSLDGPHAQAPACHAAAGAPARSM